jgi:general secretion pathway protein H
MGKMPISATGSNRSGSLAPRNRGRVSPGQRGFSLLELMAALAVAGLVLALAVPATLRFYDSLKVRQSVRDTITLLASARQLALQSGRAQDVIVSPSRHTIVFNDETHVIPQDLRLAVRGAAEVNLEDAGVIRFYPEGGASGGGIDIENPGSGGVSIDVDWLAGRVTHERYDLDN